MANDGRELVMESLDFRGVPNPLANPAKQGDEVPIFSQITGAVNTHAAKYGNGFHIPTTGITDAEVANIGESKLNFTIPPWTPVTYALNWSTTSGSDAVSYRKFANKMVQLSGAATKNIALLASDLICTLPTGFRPDRLARFVIYGASGIGVLVPAFLTISTAGEVRLIPGSTSPSQYIAIPNNTMFYAA